MAPSAGAPVGYELQLDHGAGDVPGGEQEVIHLLPPGTTGEFHVTARVVSEVELALRPESVALGGFGAITALVCLVLGALGAGPCALSTPTVASPSTGRCSASAWTSWRGCSSTPVLLGPGLAADNQIVIGAAILAVLHTHAVGRSGAGTSNPGRGDRGRTSPGARGKHWSGCAEVASTEISDAQKEGPRRRCYPHFRTPCKWQPLTENHHSRTTINLHIERKHELP